MKDQTLWHTILTQMKFTETIKHLVIQLTSPRHDIPRKWLQSRNGGLAAYECGKHCPLIDDDCATTTEPPYNRNFIPEDRLNLDKLRNSPVITETPSSTEVVSSTTSRTRHYTTLFTAATRKKCLLTLTRPWRWWQEPCRRWWCTSYPRYGAAAVPPGAAAAGSARRSWWPAAWAGDLRPSLQPPQRPFLSRNGRLTLGVSQWRIPSNRPRARRSLAGSTPPGPRRGCHAERVDREGSRPSAPCLRAALSPATRTRGRERAKPTSAGETGRETREEDEFDQISSSFFFFLLSLSYYTVLSGLGWKKLDQKKKPLGLHGPDS